MDLFQGLSNAFVDIEEGAIIPVYKINIDSDKLSVSPAYD